MLVVHRQIDAVVACGAGSTCPWSRSPGSAAAPTRRRSPPTASRAAGPRPGRRRTCRSTARGDQHRAETDRVDGVQHAATEFGLLRRELQQVLVEDDVGGHHHHPRHAAVGVEPEDGVQEVEHVGFHQDQRDQQVDAEEDHAAGVVLGDAGERVGPGQRTGVRVRHVDFDLADAPPGTRPASGPASPAGSSGRSPGTGAPAGWRCRDEPRRRWQIRYTARNSPTICLIAPKSTQPGPARSIQVHQLRLFCGVFGGMNRR